MKNVIERILNLLAFLLTSRLPVTAEEIRNTVAGYEGQSDAAFHRMFERDKELLRRIGIPLDVRAPDVWSLEKGYAISPAEYRMPDPGLTDEERAALWLAAQVVRIGEGGSGFEALLKLGGVSLAASVEPFGANLGANVDTLAEIFKGITERRLTSFRYRGEDRRVAPHGIGHARGHWYLVGIEDGGSKVFRVDRMEEISLGEKPAAFKRTPGISIRSALDTQPWEIGDDESQTALVRFDESVAWWALRNLGRAEEPGEGPIEVEISVSNPAAFVGWVLGFGPKAEILAPPDLRAALVRKVKESL